ncbi:hypothetical protein SAMN04487869_10895 [Marinobacter sp. DSM 26671]|uniref:hypothetical protein n=1 Tax=Marinobacter sp. DSM 26671 TaxID=1761793 RepID=UPI0008F24387|nr:hypothetical protein [Marinobacter sp. DSM 26671]SFE46143.1 hypothetical protein SAMN04487869_10895 [Marinobacter sp. DSM 26671]
MSDVPVDPTLAQERALARRRKRKAEKRKNAVARDSFLTSISGSPDKQALAASMKALMEREGIGPFGEPPARTSARSSAGLGPAPMAFPANNTNRWVPIGPSVVRQGQAEGRPRVSGRVRDLAVSPDGQRAYAGTAKGGVWYTGDGGATWEPLGGWANEPRRFGGNTSAFACGCLLVNFGANAGADFVMVGTGEFDAMQGVDGADAIRGVGILAASGPAAGAVSSDPWETATGIAALEGVSITRMVRVPGSAPGAAGDRVIAATSGGRDLGWNIQGGGLYLGTRSMVGGNLSFTWSALPLPAPAPSPPANGAAMAPVNRAPTDLCYVGNRLFVCFRSSGIAFSDDHGNTFNWITQNFLPAPTVPATGRLDGRMSMAVNDDNTALYILGEVTTNPAGGNPVPHIWQIANPGDAAPIANPLNNIPSAANLWPGQRDYDQAIVVTTRNTALVPPPVRTDRVYIGGSLIQVNNWNASIWAFDVNGNNLVPSPGVSDQPVGTNSGATQPGLIGDAVHPDVHSLRKATNADGSRQIWVGCDGGVFVSLRDGQTNTFSSRNVGLASIESIFSASHPTSSHFSMLGCQDNGRQVRVGSTVWEMKTSMQGDGGGVTFHPVQSHYVMGQFANADWACDPAGRYRAPCNLINNDPESNASNFYSGIDTVRRAAGNLGRVALGTNRVWVTDNLGTSNPNTWRVLPITAAGTFVQWRDGRPGNRTPSTAANMAFGVPPAGFGPVVTVKWVDERTLLALFNQGVIRYSEDPGNAGRWTSTALIGPGVAAPAAPLVTPQATFFTDIAPVPGTSDFYLVTTGQTNTWTPAVPATPTSAAVAAVSPTAAADSCFYYDDAAGGCRLTGLGQALPPMPPLATSPIDPAYSVTVDPANPNTVYVGTSTAVWTATRIAGNAHGPWQLFVNGLPEAVVQDLHIWQDPSGAGTSPRLMRATLQSRGVWEVNLAAAEPARTYVRVHPRDDRRMFPTPMQNPRRRPGATAEPFFASPDIVVRPEAPVGTTPSFRGTNIWNGNLRYQLWAFQTAFRWIYPSVIPNGEWSDQMGDLVERHRRLRGIANPGARRIDAALWADVMANALDENGSPGVYRAPWQNAAVPALPGSEIDLMETVVPRRIRNSVWQVYRERSTVDVSLHHRDTRPVAANGAFVVLLWRSAASQNTLLGTDCTNVVPFVRSLTGGAPQPTPPGWNVALAADGTPLNRLSVDLSARMPRAVSINVDFSGVSTGHRILLLAVVGSTNDVFSAVPTGPVTSVENLVRNWPHAAARVVSVWPRPGNQLFP